MPLTLTHVWPTPPQNDPPLLEGGAEHSQAWARYFQGVSDELGAIAGTFTTMRETREAFEAALDARMTALEARVAALEGP